MSLFAAHVAGHTVDDRSVRVKLEVSASPVDPALSRLLLRTNITNPVITSSGISVFGIRSIIFLSLIADSQAVSLVPTFNIGLAVVWVEL